MERLVIFVWKGIDVTLVCALNRIKTGLECPNNDFNYKIECIKLVELVFDVLLFGTYIPGYALTLTLIIYSKSEKKIASLEWFIRMLKIS